MFWSLRISLHYVMNANCIDSFWIFGLALTAIVIRPVLWDPNVAVVEKLVKKEIFNNYLLNMLKLKLLNSNNKYILTDFLNLYKKY